MAKELASAINEADCMPFPDELNLSTSIQPSESLSQPIPSSSGLSEMSQINPTPSKQPKISDTAESGQYSSMLIDAQPSVMISDAQHPPMNVSNETASSTVTRGTKRGKGKSAGNKEKCPAKRKRKLPNVNHHVKTLRIAVVFVVECILKEVVTTGFYVTHVIHGLIGIVQDWTMTNYGIIIPKQIDITTVLFVKQVIETIEQSCDYNYWVHGYVHLPV